MLQAGSFTQDVRGKSVYGFGHVVPETLKRYRGARAVK